MPVVDQQAAQLQTPNYVTKSCPNPGLRENEMTDDLPERVTSDTAAEPGLNRRDLFAATAAGVAVSGAVGATAAAQEPARNAATEMAIATAEDYERDPTRWGSPAVA